MLPQWLQIQGDPALRRRAFEQERIDSSFDRCIDEVLNHVEVLIAHHGIFHAKIHFSTGQVTLWSLDDPLRYRVFLEEEFFRADDDGHSPLRTYTKLALMDLNDVAKVLDIFKRLRSLDPHIYLRAGSLNVVNGKIGLHFSCDGVHYIDYKTFVEQGDQFYQ